MQVSVQLLSIIYSRVYPELDESIEQIAKTIPSDFLKMFAARVVTIQVFDNFHETYLKELDLFFIDEKFLKEEIIKIINANYSDDEQERLELLNPLSSLKILELSIISNNTDNWHNITEYRKSLFRLYLKINEINLQTHIINDGYIKKQKMAIQLPLFLLNASFYAHDLINFSFKNILLVNHVKCCLLFFYLQKNSKYDMHFEEFKKIYNVNSVFEYLARIIEVCDVLNTRNAMELLIFRVSKNSNSEFYKSLTVQNISSDENIDFRAIRSHPLLLLESNTYTTSHPLFITDKLFKGIYFDFNFINSSLKKNNKISNFRSVFTTEFSENTLLYEIMNFINVDTKKTWISGKQIKDSGCDEEPDYLIINENSIVVFENKDVLINAKFKETPILENLITEIRNKLLVEDNGRGVGVRQLVTNIRNINKSKYKIELSSELKKITIYPVLITYDNIFNAPGINKMINNWFIDEINNPSIEKLHFKCINPICVINIDTIIQLSELIRDRLVSFEEVFQYYFKVAYSKPEFDGTLNDLESKTNLTMMSPSYIIENMIATKFPEYTNKSGIMDFAFGLMEKSFNEKEARS